MDTKLKILIIEDEEKHLQDAQAVMDSLIANGAAIDVAYARDYAEAIGILYLEKQKNQNQTELIKKWQQLQPGNTPVIFTEINGQEVAIKDESRNSTGTFKDWHGWMMGLHYLNNFFPKPFTYYIVSTGNAAVSDFYYADVLNHMLDDQKITVVGFYPEHHDTKLLGPDNHGRFTDGKRVRKYLEEIKSGIVIPVDFNEKQWFDECQDNQDTPDTPCLDKMIELGLDVSKTNSLNITEGFNPTYNLLIENFVEQIQEQYGEIPLTLAIIQFGAGILYYDVKTVIEKNQWPIDFLLVSKKITN